MVNEQITMIQVLQAQMEELRQKGIADQLWNEEDQRQHEEEMSLLKEQNKNLEQRLDGREREEQSRAPPPTHQTHQTHQINPTHQTHQSSRNTPPPNDEGNLRGHSFTDKIIDTPLPPKWKGLIIKLYDGSTDPNKDLNVFKTQMTLYTTNKEIWCKVFPASLQEGPLGWFTGLPPNFVGNFKVLTTKFIIQYATS